MTNKESTTTSVYDDHAQYQAARLAQTQEKKERILAEIEEINLAQKLRGEAASLANDYNNRRYVFNAAVSTSSVEKCMQCLGEWSRTEPGCPIELVIMSPGGEVFPGMGLFDFLRTLSHAGHHITTVALGYAASMGGILLQAGDTRVMGKESYVLIHEVSAGGIGKVGEMEDKVELMKVMCARTVRIFAERSNLTTEFIEEHWKRTDWWLTSEECLEHGLVDEVR